MGLELTSTRFIDRLPSHEATAAAVTGCLPYLYHKGHVIALVLIVPFVILKRDYPLTPTKGNKILTLLSIDDQTMSLFNPNYVIMRASDT